MYPSVFTPASPLTVANAPGTVVPPTVTLSVRSQSSAEVQRTLKVPLSEDEHPPGLRQRHGRGGEWPSSRPPPA